MLYEKKNVSNIKKSTNSVHLFCLTRIGLSKAVCYERFDFSGVGQKRRVTAGGIKVDNNDL